MNITRQEMSDIVRAAREWMKATGRDRVVVEILDTDGTTPIGEVEVTADEVRWYPASTQ